MKTTDGACIECGCYGECEITCALAGNAPPPPPPPARATYRAVIDGARLDTVCVTVPETTPVAEVQALLADRLATRLYQQTYEPLESMPIFTIERGSVTTRRRGR